MFIYDILLGIPRGLLHKMENECKHSHAIVCDLIRREVSMKLHWFRRKVSKEVNMYEREVWTLSMYGMESIEFVDSFKRKRIPIRRRVSMRIIT